VQQSEDEGRSKCGNAKYMHAMVEDTQARAVTVVVANRIGNFVDWIFAHSLEVCWPQVGITATDSSSISDFLELGQFDESHCRSSGHGPWARTTFSL
jgi:hypothetical protein